MVHAHNMKHQMKNRYRVFRRGWGTFYCEDNVTKQQTTLKTRDKEEAFRLVASKNETEEAPAFSLHFGPRVLEGRRSRRRQTDVAARHGRNPEAQGGGDESPLACRHQGQGV